MLPPDLELNNIFKRFMIIKVLLMSPAPGYQHGIINGNIYTVIKQGLKKVCALFLWKI